MVDPTAVAEPCLDVEVRSYRPADTATYAAALAEIRLAAFPYHPMRPTDIGPWLKELTAGDGRAWVVLAAGVLAGYATVKPVPGLDGIFDLDCCIDPDRQRQGLGGRLLRYLLDELKGSAVRQVAHPVSSLHSPAARFLLHHDFFVEHQEWRMILDDLTQLPPIELPAGFRVGTYPQSIAIRRFRRLYETCFTGLPWYQPYLSEQGVAAELADPTDILFLLKERTPIGFAWTRWYGPGTGEIEPIGVEPSYQERALGRQLLTAALHQLGEQGAHRVRIGAWRGNQGAIALYERLGFRHQDTLTYLAFNTNDDVHISSQQREM